MVSSIPPPRTTDEAQSALVVGGRYRVGGRVARGGMSWVYRGSHDDLHTPVAVKLLDPEAATDTDVVAAFLREARLLARVRSDHPSLALDLARLLDEVDLGREDDWEDARNDLLTAFGTDRLRGRGARLGRIGPYTLERMVSSGPMGTVYEAEQERPARRVALKVLHTSGASERRLRRFEDEIEILGLIEHEAVARIYDSGTLEVEGEEMHYFAMEWIDGAPLHAWVEREDPTNAERLRLFRGFRW